MIVDGPEVGSIWIHRFRGFRIRVDVASCIFVYCAREDGGGRFPVPRALFRERFVRWRTTSTTEARTLRSRFSMSLANLDHAHVFVLVGEEIRFIARSADRSAEESRLPRRGSPPVPESAVFIGTYAHPFPSETFLSDLAYVLTEARAA